ncbi:MAG: DUF3109 family protein [Bacteroidota bacterium]
MIQIGDKIVSTDLFEEVFHCHLDKCHGNCCVYGDSGAPLEEDEAKGLEDYYENIKEFISDKGVEAIEDQGEWVVDGDGDKVTPLIQGNECAYTYFKNGIAFCGIEKAWEQGKVPFKKPLSCHLYPIRVSKVGDMTALNYHRWPICDPARRLGREMALPVFRFLKDAIIRAWGREFYQEMELVYKEWKKKTTR